MEKTRHDSAVMNFRVRDATINDQGAMSEIHASAIMAINSVFYSEAMKQSWATGLRPEGYAKGESEGEHYRVAVDSDNHVCGFCSTKADTLVALYVRPEHQGNGLGTLLLNDYERNIERRGVPIAKLTASLNAEAFYVTRGWVTTSSETFQSRGGLSLQVVKMTKAFDLRTNDHAS